MKFFFVLAGSLLAIATFAQKEVTIKKKDRKKDVLLQTSMGDILIRLSDSPPFHRGNFIKLIKQHYYDSLLFHRVINHFMIQSGDPDSKHAPAGKPLGEGGPAYTVPAEFRQTLFHKKGVIAAAREGDQVNPEKASSGRQFYIVQGRKFTDGGLDSLEIFRLKGRKIPADQREAYKTLGGTPHLDQGYTVFGEVVNGLEVVDKIAAVPTSKSTDRDRPLENVMIIKASLVKRKKRK